MAEEQQKREDENNEIKEMGTLNMKESGSKYGIQLLTIIGEIEGHDSVSGNTKATKYEHLLPRLAQIEEDDETDGVLILLNTLGGDVEAGLDPDVPYNYFPHNDPQNTPRASWRSHGNLLFTNWLNYYVYQSTPYDLGKLRLDPLL